MADTVTQFHATTRTQASVHFYATMPPVLELTDQGNKLLLLAPGATGPSGSRLDFARHLAKAAAQYLAAVETYEGSAHAADARTPAAE